MNKFQSFYAKMSYFTDREFIFHLRILKPELPSNKKYEVKL